MESHPVADMFPLSTGDDFAALVADIDENGLLEDIETFEGKIIDGRNRFRACEVLGIEPRFKEWDGKGSLVRHVVSKNLHRRHLDASQRGACGVKIERQLAVEAKRRQRAAGGNRGNQHTKVATPPPPVEERIPQPAKRAPQARDEAAAIVGANPRYISAAKKLEKEAPDLFEAVFAGTEKTPRAMRQLKRREKQAALEAVAAAAAAAPASGRPKWEIIQGDCVELMRARWPHRVRPARPRDWAFEGEHCDCC
jgi:hypothetical protein